MFGAFSSMTFKTTGASEFLGVASSSLSFESIVSVVSVSGRAYFNWPVGIANVRVFDPIAVIYDVSVHTWLIEGLHKVT